MLTIALLLQIVGIILGFGATTILDLQSVKARTSTKWREVSLYTQRITRPIAWLGTALLSVSSVISLIQEPSIIYWIQAGFSVWLTLTGIGFTLVAIPEVKRRLTNNDFSPYSKQFMWKIIPLFGMSLIGWWGQFALFIAIIYQFS